MSILLILLILCSIAGFLLLRKAKIQNVNISSIILSFCCITGLFLFFTGGKALLADGQNAIPEIGLFLGGIIMFLVPVSLEYCLLRINKKNNEIITETQKINKLLEEISKRLKN